MAKKPELSREEIEAQQIRRMKLPIQGEQFFGIVEKRLGASRMRVSCMDGKSRICRIPGRLKKFLWVREGDVVIVQPWEHQADDKGDVVYKYTKTQTNHLRKKGYLQKLDEFQEF